MRCTSSSFNSRTREGCDSDSMSIICPTLGFQFTHPGGVRQEEGEMNEVYIYVSIHAPGRGATWI